MKFAVRAIVIAATVVGAAPATAQTPPSGAVLEQNSAAPSLDERIGCGLLLVTFDDFVRRYPSLGSQLGRDGGQAMVRMMGANGAVLMDAAFAEGLAQGVRPSALHRRGVGYVAEAFRGVKGLSDQAGKERAMQLVQRCLTVAAPVS